MSASPQLLPIPNRLLATLPRAAYERLLPQLELVRLAKGSVLYEIGDPIRYVYFINVGFSSLLTMSRGGETMEVAMVGREGLIGLPALLSTGISPYQVLIQFPGEALRMKAHLLREEFKQGGQLQEVTLRYTQSLISQIIQSTLCSHFHSIEERLCRWLLLAQDHAASHTLELTHEFLSHLLGAPRTGVSVAAGTLQQAGLIRYGRGRITILHRSGLEARTCECYPLMREELEQLFTA